MPDSISPRTRSATSGGTEPRALRRRLFMSSLLACASLCGGHLAHATGETRSPAAQRVAPTSLAVAVAAPAVPAPLQLEGTGLTRMPDGRLLATDIARIVGRGELVVAMLNVNTPPFFYFDDKDQWVGLDVSLAASLAKELGVKLRINRDAGTFNAVVDLVAAGKADLAISKLSRTLSRSQTIAFSNSYLTLNHALILNRLQFAQLARGRLLPEVIRSFDGSMGVIAKSSFADFARTSFPKARIQEYPSWNDVQVALYKGEVVSAYRDEFEVKRMLKADPKASLVLRTVTLKDLEDTLGIGVAISDRTVLAYVNQFLAQRTEKLDINTVLQALDR